MKIFEKIKSYFLAIRNSLKSFLFKNLNQDNLSDTYYNKYVNIYHADKFSSAFINVSLLSTIKSEQLEELINYVIIRIQEHIKNTSALVNIICILTLEDNINASYTHSITYKKLFKKEEFLSWKNMLQLSINELMIKYNDSNIKKIEIRFDYILNQN